MSSINNLTAPPLTSPSRSLPVVRSNVSGSDGTVRKRSHTLDDGASSSSRTRRRTEDALKADHVAGPLYSGRDPTLRVLSDVLGDSKKREALQELKGEPAQLLIDFLHSLLLQREPSTSDLLPLVLVVLHDIMGGSLLYPQCHDITDIQLTPGKLGAAVPIGGGGTGLIYEARHRASGQALRLKVVRRFSGPEFKDNLKVFAREAIPWEQLVHPNILPFYGIYYFGEEREHVCLVSPWMDNGDIVQYLNSDPSSPRVPFIHDVASGLEYLHGNNIIHGGLKGANVLVTRSGKACIADFGITCLYHDGLAVTMTETASPTYRWAAPELLTYDKPPTQASDVWAFGCVCYEILTRKQPYYKLSDESDVKEKIETGVRPERPEDPTSSLDTIDDTKWDLMTRCWAAEPERPSCQEILKELNLSSPSECNTAEYHEDMQFRKATRNHSIPMDRVRNILHEL